MNTEYINITGNEETTLRDKDTLNNLESIVIANKHDTNVVYVDIYFWESSLPSTYNPNNWDDQYVKTVYYFMKNVTIEKGNTLTLDSNDLSSYDSINYSLAVKLSDPDSNVDLIIKSKGEPNSKKININPTAGTSNNSTNDDSELGNIYR